jgi:hypothetical protein
MMGMLDRLLGGSAREVLDIPLFPLNTVLFPGTLLPLKVFEQRYIEMTGDCLRDGLPFGVCLIREGAEVGEPALPEDIGCLANILEWDMQQLGIFHLLTLGGRRFRVLERRTAKSGLITARAELLPDEAAMAIPDENAVCADLLRLIVEQVGAEHFREPFLYDDAAWVGFRLSEVLPLKLIVKQKLLELSDTRARLQILQKYLVQQGLAR